MFSHGHVGITRHEDATAGGRLGASEQTARPDDGVRQAAALQVLLGHVLGLHSLSADGATLHIHQQLSPKTLLV